MKIFKGTVSFHFSQVWPVVCDILQLNNNLEFDKTNILGHVDRDRTLNIKNVTNTTEKVGCKKIIVKVNTCWPEVSDVSVWPFDKNLDLV